MTTDPTELGRQTGDRERAAMIRTLVSAMICLLAATEAQARMASGRYGGMGDLLLGIDDRTGVLTGNFYSSRVGNGTDQAPQFSCSFYFRGLATGDKAVSITSWWPSDFPSPRSSPPPSFSPCRDVITGTIAAAGNGVRIKLDQLPGGCGMTIGDELINEGVDSELQTRGGWSSVRVVRAARSDFHTGPDSRSARTAYVVRDDALGVFRRANGWVEAAFVSDAGKQTRGWIRETDLYPETLPRGVSRPLQCKPDEPEPKREPVTTNPPWLKDPMTASPDARREAE